MPRPMLRSTNLRSCEDLMAHRRGWLRQLAAFGLVAVLTTDLPGAEVPASSSSESIPVVSADGSDVGARQPQAAVDTQGRIYVAFGQGNKVRCAVSADGGKSFRISTVGSVAALSLGMRRGPRIAATDKAIVVTAIGGKVGKGRDGDLLAWRSGDGGATWNNSTRINRIEGSAREGLHGMAASAEGTLFCAWLDLRNQRTEIFGARSIDGGKSWEQDALVYRSPEKSVCECCHPSVAFAPDGPLYVMWRNQLQGKRDLYFARSIDGGQSFGAGEKLGRGSWPLNACPMDGGAIAAGHNGQVETVWMRAGSMFAARPGEAERALGPGVQGWTAYGPGGAYSVWLEKRPGRLLARVPGEQGPHSLVDQANDPVIAAAPDGRGPVVAVWEGNVAGREIVLRVLATRDREGSR